MRPGPGKGKGGKGIKGKRDGNSDASPITNDTINLI